MKDHGRILIADDEETFLLSTAELLRKAGFECHTARDGHEASERLREQEFDLLIADIKMPGNMNLETISDLPKLAEGMPVILATGYPDISTATRALELPVVAYVVKPCDFDDLLSKVRTCLSRAELVRAIQSTRERLADWQQELSQIDSFQRTTRGTGAPLTTSSYLTLTVENIIGSLLDIKHLVDAMAHSTGQNDVAKLLSQRPEGRLRRQLEETSELLQHHPAGANDPEVAETRRRIDSLMGRI
jgi:DNA-binding response OmpR family regulator